MMRISSVILATMFATASTAVAMPAAAQDTARVVTTPVPTDSVVPIVRRAQHLINTGNGASGRALLDSLLERTDPRSSAEAEVLFWRATLAESWDAAQRDYLRLMLEHDRSPRSADAMLRLAQGEVTRGDRDAALRFLERLAREAPESPARAEASLWHGRLMMDRGDRAGGCAMLRSGRARVSAGQIELENQYGYLLQACPTDVASAPAPTQPAAPPTSAPEQGTPPSAPAPVPSAPMPQTGAPSSSGGATTTPHNAPPRTTPANPPANPPVSRPAAPSTPPATSTPAAGNAPTGAMAWSVQIGAFGTKAEADDFAGEVKELGYETRVDGTAAPFRVRFGYFASREAAERAMADYKARARADAVLAQVRRP